LLAAVDSGCIALSNNAIHNAGADGAACESIGRFIELVVDSLFKVCTCVAVDGTKRPGRTAGNMSAVDVIVLQKSFCGMRLKFLEP
jgi:hypothetical protein